MKNEKKRERRKRDEYPRRKEKKKKINKIIIVIDKEGQFLIRERGKIRQILTFWCVFGYIIGAKRI